MKKKTIVFVFLDVGDVELGINTVARVNPASGSRG
jgi:hypothetical protein